MPRRHIQCRNYCRPNAAFEDEVTVLVNPIPKIIPKPVIIGFFVLGLLSSVAFRAIILFQKFNPGWVRPIWNFGVIGYMLFFMYRYSISSSTQTNHPTGEHRRETEGWRFSFDR